MTSITLQVDDETARDIRMFLAGARTGQVVLHVVKGVIEGSDCNLIARKRRRDSTTQPKVK